MKLNKKAKKIRIDEAYLKMTRKQKKEFDIWIDSFLNAFENSIDYLENNQENINNLI